MVNDRDAIIQKLRDQEDKLRTDTDEFIMDHGDKVFAGGKKAANALAQYQRLIEKWERELTAKIGWAVRSIR